MNDAVGLARGSTESLDPAALRHGFIELLLDSPVYQRT